MSENGKSFLNVFTHHFYCLGNVPPIEKLHKSPKEVTEDEWRKVLPEEVFHVAREAGTEPPNSSKFVKHCATGKYNCFCCGAELFV
jgi:peptide-methionine (R)-S-oxide reductase